MFRVFSNILLTSYSRHSMFSSPSININRISSITGTSSITIYNSLYSISSRRPLILSLNIQSISQRRQSRLSPTRSTINRNMLIHTPTHIVLSSNISPVPYLRNIINIQVFKRLSRQNKIRNIISSFIIHTRIYRFSFQIGLFFRVSLFFFNSFFLFFIGLSPSINRDTIRTFVFNTDIVNSSNDFEHTFFSPVFSPTVSS